MRRRFFTSAFCFTQVSCFALAISAYSASTNDVQDFIKKSQWNDAAESTYEIISKTPKDGNARLWGAYALFQKGYPNAALSWLKSLSPQDWKNFPQGQDRLVEIISLFQKKVPLTLLPGRLEQLNVDEVSPQLQEEVRYAKGRAAFEKGAYPEAKKYLDVVSSHSRFFAQSKYILATIAAKQADYPAANAELSKIFEPQVLDRSAEFWRDLNTQTSTHWGASLHVSMDSTVLLESNRLAELALLALARTAYATKDFNLALNRYSQILAQKDAKDHEKAALERIWTLLALNRHEESQKAASELSTSGQGFEALQARTLRALVLVDIARSDESRSEIASFQKSYQDAKAAIDSFENSGVEAALPAFLKKDIALDTRLQTMIRYKEALLAEIAALHKEDLSLFPVYASLATQLEPLVTEASDSIKRGIRDHVYHRRSDLEGLYLQSRLILAETYLEDREKLRNEFRNAVTTDVKLQQEHDRRLVEYLTKAIAVVDEVIDRAPVRRVRLEFRQSELLWELSGARGIVAQTNGDKKEQAAADELKERSIRIAKEIVEHHPEFENHAQAMFFLGYALIDTGKTTEGYQTLVRYTEQYRKHNHVPDAYRILADTKFDGNQFAAAEALYRKILEFPNSPVVGYAFYKIGWCAYQLRDFGKALLALEKATLWAVKDSGSHLLSLKKESRHDLVSFYAEVGDHRKAYEYFTNVFHSEAPSWLSDLAGELNRIGQYEKSIDLYHTLMAIEPNSEDNIARQAEVLRGEFALRRWSGVIDTAHKLVTQYGPQLMTAKGEESVTGHAEKALREIVLSQLYEYRKAPSEEVSDRVQKLDQDYLGVFQAWPSSQEPLYQHAHFLLSKKDYVGASKHFRQHWQQFHETLKEPLREEALRNFIFAMDNSPEGQKSLDEIVNATVEYEKSYPKTKYARSVLFLRSTILFKQQHVEEGIKLSQTLFDENPADDIGKRAFKNLRVAYYDLKNWERAYQWSSEQIASKQPGMKLYADDLKTVREETLFLWADKTTENAKSAELFLKIADDPQMAKLHGKALYNAFVRYQNAGDRIAALETANRLQKSVPNFEMLGELSGVRAAYYQEAGDYAHALGVLDAFLKSPPKSANPETLLQARFNHALILEALAGQEAKDQRAEARKAYEEFIRLASKENMMSAKVQEARRGLERLDHSSKRSPASPFKPWAALEAARAEFDRQPIPAKGELAARIKKGAEHLEQVATRFVEVSNSSQTPVFYAMEAYCTLPFLYTNYVKSLRSIPDSMKELKATEATELRAELEKIADPIQGKIKTLAAQCLSKSEELEHEGPTYLKVNEAWGWMADAQLREKTQQIASGLKSQWPWVDEVKLSKSEETKLIQLQFQKKDTEESWYALSMLRWKPASYSLSRLTLVDTLNRYPESGRTLNALACIEEMDAPEKRGLASLYEKAGEKGSRAAWANLAYYHLKGGRLGSAIKALNRGLEEKSFNQSPDLKTWIQELVKK